MNAPSPAPGESMIIESATYTPCLQRQEDPSWRFSRGGIPQILGWIVTLTSRSGEQGWGHVLTTPIANPDAARTESALKAALPLVVGHRPLDQQQLHAVLAESCRDLPCIQSGITSAALELAARCLRVPLHALLGGTVRHRIPATRLIPIKSPELMATEALQLQSQGYLGLKLKLNGEADTDIARVRAVRAAVGADLLLTVDANQAYDADTAIEVCRALSEQQVTLMEQPVPAADRDGLRRITQSGVMRIEADEAIGSLRGLVELIAMGAAHSYNLKVPYMGGLRNTLTAARLCEAAGVQCRLGAIFGPRLASAQAAHLAAGLQSIEGGAEIAESEHLLDDPFAGFDAQDGHVLVSDSHGSGVSLRAR
ncbi:Mandelate racemase/muconate lactonizing enzyme C-terminal domain-containing protein [Bordetella tumbae]|uniref:mandelate racemase/muconate lactonizing enzyme family protein n=1 Tax=Bordetella tumbae TaxID=1649139 RepID=UPI0039F14E46